MNGYSGIVGSRREPLRIEYPTKPKPVIERSQTEIIKRAEMLAEMNERSPLNMTKTNVNVRKLHPDAIVPQYAKSGDSGFDLVAVEDVVISPGKTALVPTGLSFEIPDGLELQVRPRSGVSLKTKLRVANTPGTVDTSYRGEVKIIVDNITVPDECRIPGFYPLSIENTQLTDDNLPACVPGTYIIRKGDRIAQGVIAPVSQAAFTVVDTLSDTERGASGFGHSGVRIPAIGGGPKGVMHVDDSGVTIT
jgi:dUTP pyrophosphatase